MKKQILFITAMAAIVCIAMYACNTKAGNKETTGTTDFTNKELIERGSYLVTIAGCDDCHTPKKMGPMGPELDMERRLSGYNQQIPFPKVDTNLIKQGWSLVNPDLTGWAGMWGASFTANITSDETGIGNWTFDQFKKAFQQGKWKGMDNSRPLMPPMPWQNYSQMKEDDVKAVFAFLKSTRPIKNAEPPIKPFSDL